MVPSRPSFSFNVLASILILLLRKKSLLFTFSMPCVIFVYFCHFSHYPLLLQVKKPICCSLWFPVILLPFLVLFPVSLSRSDFQDRNPNAASHRFIVDYHIGYFIFKTIIFPSIGFTFSAIVVF